MPLFLEDFPFGNFNVFFRNTYKHIVEAHQQLETTALDGEYKKVKYEAKLPILTQPKQFKLSKKIMNK